MKHDLDLRLVVDATPTLIFSARPDGYIDYVNRRWLDLVGVPVEGVEGWAWTDFIHPDDRERHVRRWLGVLSVAFGVLMAIYPGAGALAMLWRIAAYALVFGALLIVLGFQLRSRAAHKPVAV